MTLNIPIRYLPKNLTIKDKKKQLNMLKNQKNYIKKINIIHGKNFHHI